jgi:hypothetical protein
VRGEVPFGPTAGPVDGVQCKEAPRRRRRRWGVMRPQPRSKGTPPVRHNRRTPSEPEELAFTREEIMRARQAA